MPLTLPTSPTIGQRFTAGVITWEWQGEVWMYATSLILAVYSDAQYAALASTNAYTDAEYAALPADPAYTDSQYAAIL